MHASAQPAQPVRRIDFINQLSAPFTADSAPAGYDRGSVTEDRHVTWHGDHKGYMVHHLDYLG